MLRASDFRTPSWAKKQPELGIPGIYAWGGFNCTEPDSPGCRGSGSECRLVEWFYGLEEWERDGVFSGTKVLPRFEIEYTESEYSNDIIEISPLNPEVER